MSPMTLKLVTLVAWPFVIALFATCVAIILILLAVGGFVAVLVGTPYQDDAGEWKLRTPWGEVPSKDKQ